MAQSNVSPDSSAVVADQNPEQLSIALCEPSPNRVSCVRWPLSAIGHTVDVAPANPNEYDLVLLDTPGVRILRYGYGDVEPPVVYRHRGNLWRAHDNLRLGQLRTWVFDNLALPAIDGALSPDQPLDGALRTAQPDLPTAIAELPIEPKGWPSISHTQREIRALTLTNADYLPKVDPIVDWMPVVDRALSTGVWRVAGDGQHDDRLAEAAAQYDAVEYVGFVEATPALEASNLMLHPSFMDIAAPNALLEGLASNLPVITTEFPPFERPPVRQASRDTLADALRQYRDPDTRAAGADRRRHYLRDQHSPAKIGHDMTRFFQTLL